MKKIILTITVLSFIFSFFIIGTPKAEARSYYRSAVSGRYTTKSYSTSHKSTTYKSSFR